MQIQNYATKNHALNYLKESQSLIKGIQHQKTNLSGKLFKHYLNMKNINRDF